MSLFKPVQVLFFPLGFLNELVKQDHVPLLLQVGHDVVKPDIVNLLLPRLENVKYPGPDTSTGP